MNSILKDMLYMFKNNKMIYFWIILLIVSLFTSFLKDIYGEDITLWIHLSIILVAIIIFWVDIWKTRNRVEEPISDEDFARLINEEYDKKSSV